MDAKQAIETFLAKALKNKKERYLGFVSKPKTQRKFLDSIYHDLQDVLDDKKKIDSLPKHVLSMSGYKFQPPNHFGEPISSISEICDSFDESFLVVTSDGRYGIHGPESYIDKRAFYAI